MPEEENQDNTSEVPRTKPSGPKIKSTKIQSAKPAPWLKVKTAKKKQAGGVTKKPDFPSLAAGSAVSKKEAVKAQRKAQEVLREQQMKVDQEKRKKRRQNSQYNSHRNQHNNSSNSNSPPQSAEKPTNQSQETGEQKAAHESSPPKDSSNPSQSQSENASDLVPSESQAENTNAFAINASQKPKFQTQNQLSQGNKSFSNQQRNPNETDSKDGERPAQKDSKIPEKHKDSKSLEKKRDSDFNQKKKWNSNQRPYQQRFVTARDNFRRGGAPHRNRNKNGNRNFNNGRGRDRGSGRHNRKGSRNIPGKGGNLNGSGRRRNNRVGNRNSGYQNYPSYEQMGWGNQMPYWNNNMQQPPMNYSNYYQQQYFNPNFYNPNFNNAQPNGKQNFNNATFSLQLQPNFWASNQMNEFNNMYNPYVNLNPQQQQTETSEQSGTPAEPQSEQTEVNETQTSVEKSEEKSSTGEENKSETDKQSENNEKSAQSAQSDTTGASTQSSTNPQQFQQGPFPQTFGVYPQNQAFPNPSFQQNNSNNPQQFSAFPPSNSNPQLTFFPYEQQQLPNRITVYPKNINPDGTINQTTPFELAESPEGEVEIPKGKYCSLLVECVATGKGHNDRAVAHIALVDEDMKAIVNVYINPKEEVFSCLTQITTLDEEIMKKYGLEHDFAMKVLLAELNPEIVLVGHNISRHIHRLGLKKGVHYKDKLDVADCWRVWNSNYSNYTKFSLGHEVQVILHSQITCNAANDAIFAMQLFQYYLQLADKAQGLHQVRYHLISTPIVKAIHKRFPEIDNVCMGLYSKCTCGSEFINYD